MPKYQVTKEIVQHITYVITEENMKSLLARIEGELPYACIIETEVVSETPISFAEISGCDDVDVDYEALKKDYLAKKDLEYKTNT